jgi:hypothetical protein
VFDCGGITGKREQREGEERERVRVWSKREQRGRREGGEREERGRREGGEREEREREEGKREGERVRRGWRREGSHLVAVEEKVEALKDDAELLLESGHGSCPFHLDVPDAVMTL